MASGSDNSNAVNSKRAVITGATGGIGVELARRLSNVIKRQAESGDLSNRKLMVMNCRTCTCGTN